MRSRERSDRSALEDQGEAERGGCDRRGFYARCPAIGMKGADRLGASLPLHACHSLSMCMIRTYFSLLFSIFSATASARFGWLACEPAAVGFVLSSQRVAEPCSASTSIHIHKASVTRLSLCRRVAAESARSQDRRPRCAITGVRPVHPPWHQLLRIWNSSTVTST